MGLEERMIFFPLVEQRNVLPLVRFCARAEFFVVRVFQPFFAVPVLEAGKICFVIG